MPSLFMVVPFLLPGDVPPFFQPPADFYGAQGSRVTVTASVDTTRVPANRIIVWTLTVRGVANPGELKRPPLRDLSEFAKRFEVEEKPVQTPGVFEYDLRPRTPEVDRIPRLRFAYYNPAAAEGKQFPVTYTDAIPIQVLPPATGPDGITSPPVPAIFREPRSSRGWTPAGPGWLAGLSVAVLILAAGYVTWWRWRNPDGPRLARIRQTRAVRRVLGRLDAAREPAAVADALHAYLAERFGVAIPSAAPCDIDAALADAGWEDGKRIDVTALVRRCDATRFGRAGDTPATLASDARSLVRRWEGLP